MKKLRLQWMIRIFFVLTGIPGFSQKSSKTTTSFIEPYPLTVAFYKTTNLLFSYAIKSVDRGSKDLLAQKAKGVDNILQIKAGKPNFEETNLTVITADGKLYSYLVRYANAPYPLNIQFSPTDTVTQDASFSNAPANEAVLKATTEKIIWSKRSVHGISDKKYGIKLKLYGLYIKDNVMYYQIKIGNTSNINYDIEQLRFFIRDEYKAKRTASQELEVRPLYAEGNLVSVCNKSDNVIVFALPKFTLRDGKYLGIELTEKSGGRHLQLRINNRVIEHAHSL